MPDKFETIARALFPDDYHDGTDCRAEVGNEGAPCRHCAYRREEWLKRVASVKAAIEAVPAPADPVRDAAGDMLAALRDIAATPKQGEPEDANPNYVQNWEDEMGRYAIERLHAIIDTARALIAKAEGRS